MGLDFITRVGLSISGVLADTSHASLFAAVTAIGSTRSVLRITTPLFPNGANVTVPETLTLEFAGAGTLNLTTGQTVTILSDSANWPVRKIFVNAVTSQGTISFAGNRTIKDFNPEWWGALPDGFTENRTFIHAMYAAIKTAGGGRWLLSANTNYLYSPSGTYGTSLDSFSMEASNIVIEGLGWSSILTTGGSFGARFGIPYMQQDYLAGVGTAPWTLPPFARFNDASVGAATITLTTTADHALFAVGNTVFLESGDAAPTTGHTAFAFEYNEITAINTGTGVITLKYGLRDTYDSVDTDYEPRIVRLNVAPRNITLRNLRVTRAAGSIATILDFNGTRDVHIEKCWLQGTFFTTHTDGVYFDGNLIESNDPTLNSFDAGDAAQNQFIRNNIIRYQTQYGITAGGALKDFYIIGNHISNFNLNSSASIGITAGGRIRNRLARGVFIIDNTIILPGQTSFGEGINVQQVDGVVIRGNRIYGKRGDTAAAGIALLDTVKNWTVDGNKVELLTNGTGLKLLATDALDTITQGSASGNKLHGPDFGIYFSNSSAGTILKNHFYGNDFAGCAVRWRAFGFTDNTLDGWDTADMRGVATISGTDDALLVAFQVTLDNTNYYVTITPSAQTGTPAAGSEKWRITKQTDGFVIRLAAAPGTSNSISYDWKVES